MAASPDGLTFHGQCALVTGASSGIGLALADALAAAGANLVLVARRLDRLEALATALRERHAVVVHVFRADLSEPAAPAAILAFMRSLAIEVDVLVNNAGLLKHGPFASSDITPQLQMVQVHCLATLHLTRLFLPGMVARRSGHVLIVATTALMPAPYLTTYAATKGFDQLFAEGLREEVAEHGVNVSVLCAGATQSELHEETMAGQDDARLRLQPASEVAARTLAGLRARKARIHTSRLGWWIAQLPRWLPRATVAGMLEKAYRPKV